MKRLGCHLLLAALALVLGAGCRSPICPWCGHDVRIKPPQQTPENFLPAGLLTGTLTTLERGELHPMAKARVKLFDTTLHAGEEPILVCETTLSDLHSLPANFEMPIPANTLLSDHRYRVSACIAVGSTTLFSTDTKYPVLTHGAPTRVQLVLVRKPSP